VDYYYHRTESVNLNDLKHTDSGRTVYGGGGITPDEKHAPDKYNAFQRRVLLKMGFYHFANEFFGSRTPALPEGWRPGADVMQRFQTFLIGRSVPFSDAEFAQNRAWVDQQLRVEMNLRAFDRKHADRILIEEDPEIAMAISSVPRAQALVHQGQLARRMAP
jgi:carboxyl-terminal processing protease